jgi:hypothetical protein
MRKGMRFEISDFIRGPRNGGVEEWFPEKNLKFNFGAVRCR